MTPEEEQQWKRTLPLHKYAGRFELATYRTEKLLSLSVDLPIVDKIYWNDETIGGFLNFAKVEYAPIFGYGLVGTCIIIHSALVEAVKEYFNCNAVLTIGSIMTPKGELYPMDETTVLAWRKTEIDMAAALLHAWITLDSMEILDMTFLPTIADISKKEELSQRSPI